MGEKINFKFARGDEVKDMITGFKGIVVTQVAYMTGCNQVGVKHQTAKNNGIPIEPLWIDEVKLELVKG